MPIRVMLARVRAGSIVFDERVRLPDGLRVTVVANASHLPPPCGDPEERELLEALAQAEREEAARGAALVRRTRPRSS
jgi:hypothetical protein